MRSFVAKATQQKKAVAAPGLVRHFRPHHLCAEYRETQRYVYTVAQQETSAFESADPASGIQEKQQNERRSQHDPLIKLQDSLVDWKRL